MSQEPLDLDAIRARAEAATEGPWGVIDWDSPDEGVNFIHVLQEQDGLETVCALPNPAEYTNRSCLRADAEFIAHAREDVPALLAEVERLRRDRDEWEVDSRGWRKEAVAQAAKLNAVRALHVQEACCCGKPDCAEPNRGCEACHAYYPCPTIRALDGDAS